MSSEEFDNGGNEDSVEGIAMDSIGDLSLAQKDQEMAELKHKISILETGRVDLQCLVEEKASKITSLIESSDEAKRRASEASARLEETLQQLDGANSTVKALQEELRMLKSVASRASELEIQVSRLQHDLISVMNERDAILSELENLNVSFEDMQRAADSKHSTIKTLEDERNSLKERVEEHDHRLDSFVKQLENSLSDSNSRLDAEKRALDEANKKLTSIESQCQMQEEKIKDLETRLKQRAIEQERASVAYMEEEERVKELSRELEELRSQLEKPWKEKGILEELSKEKEVKLREHNQLEVEKAHTNLREIMSLEKEVSELSAKLEAAEAERRVLIEKCRCSEKVERRVPIQWQTVAAASTGTLAAAAIVVYVKHYRRR